MTPQASSEPPARQPTTKPVSPLASRLKRSSVFSLVTLFRETSRATARDLLCAIFGVPVMERAAGEHQPLHGPEAKRGSTAAERLRTVLPMRLRRTS